nr:PHYSCODILLO1 [Physcomitrium patens]AFF18619.1 PHYSCODILLO1B [Physcomitrium patens]AFF18620.1 PHYSCODILLO1A [Physcomitrium patens]
MSNKRRRNVNVAVDDQEQQQAVVYKKARITSSPTSSAASTCGAPAVPATESGVESDAGRDAHWTSLPDETVLGLFNLLNHRDRASLASVCKGWQVLGSSPSLWNSLDLRSHSLNSEMVSALAGRCSNLEALKFRRGASASSIVGLQAKGLRELSGDCCSQLSDATLSMVVARHANLESLLLGSDCERVTSEALKVIAVCCPKLRRLCVSGVLKVERDAIQALFQHCKGLTELGFLDSHTIDEGAFGGASSLRFLSVAGCRCIVWSTAAHWWSKLPNLAGLDVSRTDITPTALMQVLAGPELRVVCALNCPVLEEGSNPVTLPSSKKTVVLARFTDVMEGLDALLSPSNWKEEAGSCARSRCGGRARADSEVAKWTEWMLSHAVLKIAECNAPSLLKQGIAMMLRLVQSAQEDVQERAASALATFVVVDDENATVDSARAEAVMNGGGIALLLGLAKSCREGVQSEAAKAIANLSVNTEVAKRVALEGGISILAGLARSRNRWVAEEAAGGLWNLSVGEEHKGAIAGAGAIEALVGLAFKWPAGGEGVLERAAGALANLAADDKCSMEVAVAGGVRALVRLARFCNHEGVQEQAARALANLAAHGDSNGNNAAVGREEGALEALVQLTCSNHEGVRQEAAGALWNLSFDDRNREAIAAAGGVEALVALAQGCSSGSQGLQERAAGALWGLSVSEANSIAIGREGGVAPLITLAHSDFEDVHETAVGALWNLVFNPGNALRMVEEEGVPALVHLCSSSRSKMARFMAALALAYMFDGRMDEVAVGLSSVENNGRTVSLEAARKLALRNIDAFVQTFFDPQSLTAAASSWAGATLNQVAETATIQEAGHLRCSVAELGRFVAMLRNGHAVLRSCAAFALLQFTMPGGRHALHHAVLLQKVGASRVLRTVAAAATAAMQAKVFARVVLRNLEHHQAESNTVVALS